MMNFILSLPWSYVFLIAAKGLAAGIGVGSGFVFWDWIIAKRQGDVL